MRIAHIPLSVSGAFWPISLYISYCWVTPSSRATARPSRPTQLPRLASQVLPKQIGHIRFIIDDKNADGRYFALFAGDTFAVPRTKSRGRRTVNSVNSPSWLSIAIVPPCAFVTMS